MIELLANPCHVQAVGVDELLLLVFEQGLDLLLEIAGEGVQGGEVLADGCRVLLGNITNLLPL